MTPPDSSNAWVALGESQKYEDCLIANRAGLELLRSKIDEALQKGDVELPEKIMSATRILIVDECSNPEWIPDKHRRVKNAIGLTGCAIIFLAVGAIFFIGVVSIRSWSK